MTMVGISTAVTEGAGCAPRDFCRSSNDCFDENYCNEEGRCVPVDPAMCVPASDGSDRCGASQVCLPELASLGSDRPYRCEETVPCTGDMTCPSGGVCNDGLWAEKADEICLDGRCRVDADCSGSQARCVIAQGASIGFCALGVAGDVCTRNSDCEAEWCFTTSEIFGVCASFENRPESAQTCVERGGTCTTTFCSSLGLAQAANECGFVEDHCCI